MRKLVSLLVMSLAAVPAFAAPTFNLPEPEAYSLLAIGALAFAIAKKRTKK